MPPVFVFQLINQKIRMCMELRNSGSFVSVLEYLLAIGNYLNENAGKEKAKGFRLSSLSKVRLHRCCLTFDRVCATRLIRCSLIYTAGRLAFFSSVLHVALMQVLTSRCPHSDSFLIIPLCLAVSEVVFTSLIF